MVISVGYKKQVGKDTFYKFAKDYYKNKGRRVYRIAFGDEVKQEIFDIVLSKFGYSIEVLDDPKFKPVFRPFMQWWGTDFSRNVELGGDPLVWVKKAYQQIEVIKSKDPEALFVITDMRFHNELMFSKEHEALCVHIIRDLPEDEHSNHKSETELDDYLDEFDVHIENNGTLEEYRAKIYELLDSLS